MAIHDEWWTRRSRFGQYGWRRTWWNQGGTLLLSPELQKKFPKFRQFVMVTAPRLAAGTDVVPVMAELTGLAEATIRTALKAGNPPRVLVVPDLICNGPATGCFRRAQPNQLEIRQREVEIDEKGLHEMGWTDREIGRTKLGRSQVAVLHELVHWADFKANGNFTRAPTPYHDLGTQWEWKVFAVFDQSMIHKSL